MTSEPVQLHPLIPAGIFDLETLLSYEPPTRWRPEEGEKLVGELARIAEKTSFGNRAPTLYVLVSGESDRDGSGRGAQYLTVRASGVVLRGALEELNPAIGEPVAFKFEGFRESAAGRRYALWRFAVKRAGRWVVAQ